VKYIIRSEIKEKALKLNKKQRTRKKVDKTKIRRGVVGNDFIMPRPQLKMAMPGVPASSPVSISIPVAQIETETIVLPRFTGSKTQAQSTFKKIIELMHSHAVVTFAVLILAVGIAGSQVLSRYYSAQEISSMRAASNLSRSLHVTGGINIAVPSAELQSKLASITSQPGMITVGTNKVNLSAADIRSWLQVSPDASGSQDNIHVNPATVDNSLLNKVNQFVKAPINQVTVAHTDNITPSGVILAGVNGEGLSNASKDNLESKSHQIASSLFTAKGFQASVQLQPQAFQAVTPAAFSKLIEVDVNTKRLYAYQNGQLVQTFLASAGAPATPTPIGEFHTWTKLTTQTMTGPGYVQPNVPWISYFDHSGDAIHGNYWRPASVFGNVNTSHGCVGLQVANAEWIYNWAPIGTTIITHT
jgi:lipoprotein-anchoring transpeptidase ErfK/SrfK